MYCLVVGGTGFLGGAIVDALASGGHDVAILARGETRRTSPDGVERIVADRHGDLSALGGRPFDWVFDTCAFEPKAVHRLLDALQPRQSRSLQRYVLVSSLSVYGQFTEPGVSESDPVPDATANDHATARSVAPSQRASAMAYGASYGPLKRACEIAATERLGRVASALRVGLLVGAGDYTDRLTWWVRRIDEAGRTASGERRIPAPAPHSRLVQMIDARDAAAFAVRCAADELDGIWNVTGRPTTLGELLDRIRTVAGSRSVFEWVPEEVIVGAGIQPWTDMPLMAPSDPKFEHFLNINVDRAVAAGLRTRPLDETLVPLLEWDRAHRDRRLECGMTRAQESQLLATVWGR